jgi:hypothetical protein
MRSCALRRGATEKDLGWRLAWWGWHLTKGWALAEAVMVQVGANPTRGVQATTRLHTADRVRFP